MQFDLKPYSIADTGSILTPALCIYPEIVDSNIKSTLKLAGGDPGRWRPHIKTVKAQAVLKQLIENGVTNLKCATTLELLTACRSGARDVLLAYAVTGANAQRTREIADQFPTTRVSVLIETAEQAACWRDHPIGVFIDINPGMDRTGVPPGRTDEITELAKRLGPQFRGLHFYDGHIPASGCAQAHAGYDQLMIVVEALRTSGIAVGEVITSGTPAAPHALSYPGFRAAPFQHRISPGTVVFNDLSSLNQLPDYGYRPAALVLSTVVSHPAPGILTCDAGHKSVSADAGVPTCAVLDNPQLTPLKPSEEHLPVQAPSDATRPAVGEKLYLLARHICPTVNNFDYALMISNGRIQSVEPISARGHEGPLAPVR